MVLKFFICIWNHAVIHRNMHDQLQNDRVFRLLKVIDDFKSKGMAMEVDFSSPSERVIRALEQKQNVNVELYKRTVRY